MNDEDKIEGLGAIPHAGGVAFRVWAPHAQRVAVIGSFNDWDGDKRPMQAEENGDWYAAVAEARVGDQYKFLLTTAQGEFKRIDPYAREVTNSVGDAKAAGDTVFTELLYSPRSKSPLFWANFGQTYRRIQNDKLDLIARRRGDHRLSVLIFSR